MFKPGTNQICSKVELESKIETIIDLNTFLELRFIVKTAIQSAGLYLEKLLPIVLPPRPLIVDIAMSTVNGCNKYYKCLRKAKSKGNPILEKAVKSHEE